MLIVSMTSWPKRICNVAAVLKSLLEQDKQPDIIQINLSKEEFPNKEEDLPEDLLNLIKDSSKIDIEWLDGNDGVFKKIIPTLKKHYGEDYLLLSVDDDWIYRKDYIRMMVDYLKKYKSDCFCLSNSLIIGNRIIYKSSCFEKDFWEKLTQDIINNRIDDAYIHYYLTCKGKKMACYRPSDTPEITKKYNPIYPNSRNSINGSYSYEDIKRAERSIRAVKF